jgi:alpha-amylase/alpha-mannosidase (GH57 family)
MKRRSVVIHGHFYQPPREDPWTDRVPRQGSAAPHHDWNERIHDECYRAVVAAPLKDGEGRVTGVLNTLEWMSWDAGPTLLRWLVRERPDTYRSFLEADARSLMRTGHGNAIAQPYHHVILPLASRREKVTEVRWGITDFERRFGRRPDGMWLPETAIDTETLEVLAQEGVHFTVVGPSQVEHVPGDGLPGRVSLGGGKSIAVFVYDGPLSHEVAFGALVRDAERWIQRLEEVGEEQAVVSMATDGETFGHHHRSGETGLAAALAGAARRPGLAVEGYGAALQRHPPVEEIKVVEPSSWSCSHGIERWRADCGCKIDPSQDTSQEWRTVLRQAFGDLAETLHGTFEREGGAFLVDPWTARDDYASIIDASAEVRRAFVMRHGVESVSSQGVERALVLLEMEHDLMRMDTSCAWFFDDIARLEPLQNLLYAAHALDLAGDAAEGVEGRLIRRLEKAVSNDPGQGTGADFWRTEVRGEAVDVRRRTSELRDRTQGEDTAASTLAKPLLRVVERALDYPSDHAVRDALEALEGAKEDDLFGARAVTTRFLARDDDPEPKVAPLAERLGIAPHAEGPGLPSGAPLRFVFGLHLHQPVGNFDEVFLSHVEDVYLPFLERCDERGLTPLALHVSGPLLEWLEGRGHRLLDTIARLVDRGAVEPMLAGFYEPVLPVLAREDRLQQIGWMREWLAARFGADARALWLTERVWEPGLVRDLVDAGVEQVLLDDRHFLVAGFERHQLHRPWRTEAEGRSLSVLPIDERLRYLVPFRSPTEIGAYLRRLASAGHEVAVLADDGEKFGGWPGTAQWVWRDGWLDAFLDEMERLRDEGVIRLDTPGGVCRDVPSAGLAYLPSASYREMEVWSLPPRAAETLEWASSELEAEPRATKVLRGGHWRNFLTRYEESNRMHKKAQCLSELCREAGDPEDARRAIGRAQCNDPYWHGVFGGLYLRHLRNAIWRNLAEAEGILRAGQGLSFEIRDVDGDGHDEICVHSSTFSALVEPDAGGRLVELTDFASRINLADVLTRRRESYHRTTVAEELSAQHEPSGDGMPSIHELEGGLKLTSLPPVDPDVRALGVERVLAADVNASQYQLAEYAPVRSWANDPFETEVLEDDGQLTISMASGGIGGLSKTLTFSADGSIRVDYSWDPGAFPPDAFFAPEISAASDPGLTFDPRPDDVWRYDIITVSKKESGYEETVQGEAITPRWPCAVGRASVDFPSRSRESS